MQNFNLLPWREELDSQKQVRLLQYLTAILFSLGIATFTYQISIAKDIKIIIFENHLLKKQLPPLLKKHLELISLKQQEKELTKQINSWRNLQTEHEKFINVLQDVSKITPPYILLTNLKLQNDNINMTGSAQSQANIANLINNFELAKCLKHPEIIEIKPGDHNHLVFKLNAKTC